MSESSYSEYNKYRDNSSEFLSAPKPFGALCYAPFTSLFFDPQGDVHSCCQSINYSLGNIKQTRLADIWHGSINQRIRDTLMSGVFPSGCATCKHEIDHGNFAQTYARIYDSFKVNSSKPAWPQSLWFALSNACNLECVQCDGELSSSIRKNRDRLPPLPKVYDDQFFEDLRPFLRHLALKQPLSEAKEDPAHGPVRDYYTRAMFLGGEPFLSRENFRIWEMMIEDDLLILSIVFTNGTIFNKRVERIIEKIPTVISISLDGATRKTVELIRKNAQFDKIMVNLERFRYYSDAYKIPIVLSFCLMPQNQHEFPDFLMLTERLGCVAQTNTIYHPEQFSLAALDKKELGRVIDDWERRDSEVRQNVKHNLGLWDQEMARLRNWCSQKPHVTAC